jgi:hypothetical protein
MTKRTRKKPARIAARPKNAPLLHAEHFLDDSETRDLRNFFSATIESKDREIAGLRAEIDAMRVQPPDPYTPDAIEAALRLQPAQTCQSARDPFPARAEAPVDDEVAVAEHRRQAPLPYSRADPYPALRRSCA